MRRALDLFCCAGGAGTGLARAGFDVTGVDIVPRPSYPFKFIQADALTVDLTGYDFIWASPPCQAHTTAKHCAAALRPVGHVDRIAETRAMLVNSGIPYVIENVVGAPLLKPFTLCGSMFGLRVIRHRIFEASFKVETPPHKHVGSIVTGEYMTITGALGIPAWTMKQRALRGLPRRMPGEQTIAASGAAMGIDWMKAKELVQAIPPAYSEFIARAWLASVNAA